MRFFKTSLIIAVFVCIFFIMPSSGVPVPTDSYPLPIKLTLGYLKMEGIAGESAEKDHIKWSEILTFSAGTYRNQTDLSSGRRRGTTLFEDLTIMKEIDKTSPKIMEACAMGKVFSKVEIHITGGKNHGGPPASSSEGMSERFNSLNSSFQGSGSGLSGVNFPYVKWELINARVTSYSIDNTSNRQGMLLDRFSFNFEEIKYTYTEMDDQGKSKGNVEFQWKVERSMDD